LSLETAVAAVLPWILVRAAAVLIALWVDRRWGEPPARWHPVVAMGWLLSVLSQGQPRRWRVAAFLQGAAAWWVGAGLMAVIALLPMVAAVALLEGGAGRGLPVHALAATLAAGVLGVALKPLLSWRMLRDEVLGVDAALGESLEAGRARLSRLVSRDTAALSASDVREAAIETLAENLNDSVVAPLWWFAVGGLPAAAVYRWANTADAMQGHRGAWNWAGKWAAHADDALSWLPARLTAWLLCGPSFRRGGAWRAGLRADARATPSPNGGHPMGAMARLLGVRLGKRGVYLLNPRAPMPGAEALQAAVALASRAVQRAVALVALFAAAMGVLAAGVLGGPVL